MSIRYLLSLALAVERTRAGGASTGGPPVLFQLPPTTAIKAFRLNGNASVSVNANASAEGDCDAGVGGLGSCADDDGFPVGAGAEAGGSIDHDHYRWNSTADNDSTDDVLIAELLEWLIENGAYINPKLAVRRVVPGDPSSPRGIFATEELGADETVCRIPWELIIKPSDEHVVDEHDHDCGAIHAVADAIAGGPGGDATTPYGRYLAAQPRDYTPGFWSEPALDLLGDMLDSAREEPLTAYDELPPHDVEEFLGEEVEGACGVDVRDPTYRHAAMLVKARADHDLLVPFYDMMNHHNGKYNVKHLHGHGRYKVDSVDAKGYEIVASRRIRAGEQVYNSYNRCNICSVYYDWFGTPEMFLVYGFVEPLPQRWLFDFARVKFDLDWRDGDASTGALEVDFHVPPSRRGIALLEGELARLDAYAAENRAADYRAEGVSEGEWASLWRYHDALRDAVSHAVRSDAELVDDVWEMDDDWWVRDGPLTAADYDAEHWVLPTIYA